MAAAYTKEEDEIILKMHKAGHGPEAMAKVLKSRSIQAIKDRGYDLGIKWTKAPEIDMAEFKRLMGKT
jgi:hypothetical protein